MLAVRALCKVGQVVKPSVARVAVRSFSDVLAIPTDKEHQAGRRKEELDAESAGDIGFDHDDSYVPPADQGTLANPIMVSGFFALRKGTIAN